jgi:hypothetical protein
MKTIDVIANVDCKACHGTGYVEEKNSDKIPCFCILEQIPEDAPMEVDFRIVPASTNTTDE